MSKVLAGYVLAVAAAYNASYDKEASDNATEAARIRAREELKLIDAKSPTPSPVTGDEIRGRTLMIDGAMHTVVKVFKSGMFRTDKMCDGELCHIRRRGRRHVYLTETEQAAQEEQRVEIAMDEIIDYAQFQRKTIWQCAEEIVPHLYRQPVYLLLQTAWNDSLSWANEVMQARGPDGDDQHNFRLGMQTPNGVVDYQLSAQDELSAAFKLGQIFNADLSLETVKLL